MFSCKYCTFCNAWVSILWIIVTLSDFTLPVHLWLLSFFFVVIFTVLITEGNYSNSCMCRQALPVCVQTWLCFTVEPLVIAYIAFAWQCQITCLVGKCYMSNPQIFVLHHQGASIVCFFVFHCNSNILIHPLCLFACSFFYSQLFSVCIKTKIWLFCVWFFCSRVLSWTFILILLCQHHLSTDITPHNPRQSRRWPLWNGPAFHATVDIINGTLSLDLDVICQKQFSWKWLFFFTVK